MRRALEYAKMFDLPVMDHCQDYSLVTDGVMHEGVLEHGAGVARLAGGGGGDDRGAKHPAGGVDGDAGALPAFEHGGQRAVAARGEEARGADFGGGVPRIISC